MNKLRVVHASKKLRMAKVPASTQDPSSLNVPDSVSVSLLKGEANFRQVQTIVKYSNGDAVLFPRLRQLEESQLTPEYVRKRVMDEYHRLMEATHDPDISDALRSSQVA